MELQVKSLEKLIEGKSADLQKVQIETVEAEKEVLKRKDEEKQLFKLKRELEGKIVEANQKLSRVRVELEIEKERSQWLASFLEKRNSANKALKSEIEALNDDLELSRTKGFAEIGKLSAAASLSEQRKSQERMAKIDLNVIEPLKLQEEELNKIYSELEVSVREAESILATRTEKEHELNSLLKDTAVQEKCINAWTIKIKKCMTRNHNIPNPHNEASLSSSREMYMNTRSEKFSFNGTNSNLSNQNSARADNHFGSNYDNEVEMIEEIEAELLEQERVFRNEYVE